MKVNFAVCLVNSLGSWWQQPLAKIYDLWSQNGVLVSNYFAFKKAKSCSKAETNLALVFKHADLYN